MTHRARLAALAFAAAIPLSALGSGVASATYGGGYPPPPPPAGDEGCTPGYWKNHLGAWDVFSPSTTVGSVFGPQAAPYTNTTLLQALNADGGPGVDGAKRILLRAAVAALLNSVDSQVEYALTRGQVVTQVKAALGSNNRQTILDLATRLDRLNNAGCPL